MNRSWQISRRTLLRGAGATVALPWLNAMAAKPETAPVRMAILYAPNGVNPHHWSPKKSGADYELTEILKPLAKHRSEFNVLAGLLNPGGRVVLLWNKLRPTAPSNDDLRAASEDYVNVEAAGAGTAHDQMYAMAELRGRFETAGFTAV